MKLRRSTDPAAFAEWVTPFLIRHEAVHCLSLGLLSQIIDGWASLPYLASVEAGEVVAVAVWTSFSLVISQIEGEHEPVLRLLIDDLCRHDEALTRIDAPADIADEFAQLWQQTTGQTATLEMAQRIYQLERVNPVAGVSGEYRPATEAEVGLLVDWMVAFDEEALGSAGGFNHEGALKNVQARLTKPDRGLRLWWDEGQPVAMAGYSGPTPNGIRVNAVYTPPQFRKRGYASAAVAALSQELLDSGRKYCFLFTDLDNPTSNHIYQQVGYQPVIDVNDYRFQTVKG